MIINDRTIQLKESFTTQLAAIQDYVSQYGPIKGRELTTYTANYALDVIAPNHYIFGDMKGDLRQKRCTGGLYSNENISLSAR